jgi:multiple sugar transport system permease protein
VRPKGWNLVLIYAGLIFFAVLLVAPMIWIVFASFKTPADLFSRASFFPVDEHGRFYISLQSYRDAFAYLKIGLWMKNTLVVATVNTIASSFFNSLAGYAFARMNFPGREGIFKVLLTAMMIPGTVTLVPTFLVVKYLGLYNSLGALIWPSLVWIGTIFLFRQQFLSLPRALEDAALIDGANWFQVYYHVGLPSVRPMLVTNAVFCFLGHYNDFFWPTIVLVDPNKYTLALGLASLMGSQDMRNYHIRLAAAVMMSLPLLLVFLPFQKHITKGFVAGALK